MKTLSCWLALWLVLPMHAATRYVNVNSTNPVPPYSSWATAASVIQDAVDVAVDGDEVLVTNGVYRTGQKVVDHGVRNRVAVTNALTLRSVNGPEVTIIEAEPVIMFPNAARCVFLTNGAVLAGFTLTNGLAYYLYFSNGLPIFSGLGGGVRCASPTAVVSNCIIIGNRSSGAFGGTLNHCTLIGNSGDWGGGASDCTLNRCTLSTNWAFTAGGGAHNSTLNQCILAGNFAEMDDEAFGGGASHSTLNSCTLVGNFANDEDGDGQGGGAYFSTLNSCTLISNSANYGGGAFGCALNNCVLTGNSVDKLVDEDGDTHGGNGGGAFYSMLKSCTLIGNSSVGVGGGASESTMTNCVVFHNSAPNSSNYWNSTFYYSCTTPLPDGLGNITNAPSFIDLPNLNLRLASNSPCINAGDNAAVASATDLDGRPRITGGTVDMGAYEFQPGVSGAFIGWLQQFGLATDGSVDHTDSDTDRAGNFAEWRAGTVPTNALSVFRLLSVATNNTNLALRWSSVPGKTYVVERSTNVAPAANFAPVAQGLPGQPESTTYADTNAATGSGKRYFYRVSVE